MKKMWIIGSKSGLITVLGLIAYGLIKPKILLQSSLWGNLEYVVIALGIYSGHYYYKVANNGLMTYKQGLKLGLIITSFTGLINSFIIYLYAKFLPYALAEELTQNVKTALQQKGITAAMIEEVLQLIQHMSPKLLSMGTFISTVLIGFIITLVVAAFSRRTTRSTDNNYN